MTLLPSRCPEIYTIWHFIVATNGRNAITVTRILVYNVLCIRTGCSHLHLLLCSHDPHVDHNTPFRLHFSSYSDDCIGLSVTE